MVKTCAYCGSDEFAVGPISRSGACADCGEALAVASVREMNARQGPAWAKWLASMRTAIDRLDGGGGS